MVRGGHAVNGWAEEEGIGVCSSLLPSLGVGSDTSRGGHWEAQILLCAAPSSAGRTSLCLTDSVALPVCPH